MSSPPDAPAFPWLRILRNGLGGLLVFLGVLGFFLPFLQGILLLVIGLSLIDLPIKQEIHLRLSRYRTYRWIAHAHHRVKRAWKHRRRRLRKERAPHGDRRTNTESQSET